MRLNYSNTLSTTGGEISHAIADKDQGNRDLGICCKARTADIGVGRERAGKSQLKSKLHRIKRGILVAAALANRDPKYLPILDRLESEFEKTRRTIENNPMARAQVIAQNMPRF